MSVELPAGIELVTGPAGTPIVQIEVAGHRGEVHLHGAHVTSWQPSGHGEQLWLSTDAEYGPGTAIRGGIPVCFPWFAKGPGDWQPQHGFARRLPWQLVGAEVSADTATVRLRLTDDDLPADTPGRDLWPHPFRAELAVHCGADLLVELTLHNSGPDPVRFGGALHTYFAVREITTARIAGLDQVNFIDTVSGSETQQRGDIVFTAETDRLYRSTKPVTLHDRDRRVTISSSGATDTVVWNPWIDKAAAMADFTDDGWPHMVCVEAAVPTLFDDDPVRVGPGQSHTLSQHLTLQ